MCSQCIARARFLKFVLFRGAPPTKDVSDIVDKVLILSDSEKDFFNYLRYS